MIESPYKQLKDEELVERIIEDSETLVRRHKMLAQDSIDIMNTMYNNILRYLYPICDKCGAFTIKDKKCQECGIMYKNNKTK